MLQADPRQSDQQTQSFHFPTVIHQSLDSAAFSAQAPRSLSLHALEHSTGSAERFDALGAVEVIICMITRDFSMISIDATGVSLSLSLSLSLLLTKVTHAQYRKRFRASYNEAIRS